MTWSSRSRRQLSIHRSATPFCQGLWNEVRTGRIAIDRTAIGTSKTILGVPIEDEKSRSRLFGESLPQLLNDPATGGMSRYIEMQHPSAIMTYNEEAIEYAERQRWYGEEIHRGDGLPMIAQKGEPTFSGLRISRRSAHLTGAGSFRDVEAQHQQLTVNTRCTH